MDIIDDNLKVVLGQLIRVKNLAKRPTENDVYVSLQVEDEDGENERCILLSEQEAADMEKINADILIKALVPGRFYKFTINRHRTNVIKVKNFMGSEVILRMSDSQLARAERRAQRNKEDLTKKGFFTNLFD